MTRSTLGPQTVPRHRSSLLSGRRLTPLLVWLGLLGAGAGPLAAGGGETLRRANDMAVMVDSRWAGGTNGGYYPIRVRIANAARPRELVFRFSDRSGSDSRLPAVERRVLVDQGATIQFTLSVPLVAASGTGELRVYEGGRLLEPLTQAVSLPEPAPGTIPRPSLLVIHPNPGGISCTAFETAVISLSGGAPINAGGGQVFWNNGPVVRTDDSQVIAPAMLPESWIEFTAVDVIAVPLATLEQLPPAVRSALITWVEAGGTLLVTETGEPGARSQRLARLLLLDQRQESARVWHAARLDVLKPLASVPANQSATMGGMAAQMMGEVEVDAQGNPVVNVPQDGALEKANTSLWNDSADSFSHVELLAGRVFAFPQNPFPGAPIDWAWWLNSARWQSQLNWPARYGNSARREHPQFLQFLIPGVNTVPIVAFLVLITLFAIVIGPVNYFVVWRRRQLSLLVLTIPVIAFLTSASLFGFAMIADGFGVRSRLRSFTWLDQRSGRGMSFNRVSLYAGISPSGGLRFSPETAVLPIWRDDRGLDSGAVDWTDTQHLPSGWLRSRTSAQFETIQPRLIAGKVELRPSATGDALEAVNGLEWTIDALVVRDDGGRVFAGQELAPGTSQTLHPAEEEDYRALRAALGEHRLEVPAGAEAAQNNPYGRRPYAWYYGGLDRAPVTFATSELERGLLRLDRAGLEPGDAGLPRRAYLAALRENPGIELGVKSTKPAAAVHALLGHY